MQAIRSWQTRWHRVCSKTRRCCGRHEGERGHHRNNVKVHTPCNRVPGARLSNNHLSARLHTFATMAESSRASADMSGGDPVPVRPRTENGPQDAGIRPQATITTMRKRLHGRPTRSGSGHPMPEIHTGSSDLPYELGRRGVTFESRSAACGRTYRLCSKFSTISITSLTSDFVAMCPLWLL